MQQFDYLVRKQNRALGLFAKVSAKLKKLEAQIASVIDGSNKSIAEASKKIEEEKANLAFLNAHLAKTQESRKNVEQFLPAPTEVSRTLF